jgi:DNA-binding CsgD family transcriptional regulator
LSAFRSGDISREEELRWLALACRVAMDLWDDDGWEELSARQVRLARETGALAVLLIALRSRTGMHLHAGDLQAAASLVEESRAVAELTGSGFARYELLALAVWRGRDAEALTLIDGFVTEVVARGEGMGLSIIRWICAVLHNSFCRHEEALAAAQQASAYPNEMLFATWGLVELIEAAARTGNRELGATALQALSEHTQASGSDWALAIEARSRALLSDDAAAEPLYRESIERLSRTRVRGEHARARLLYGEWLRRESRRSEAREELRAAHEMFMAMGMEGFAERAARELSASGARARKQSLDAGDELTPQEAQISRLAAEGARNQEIAAQLFISPSTVDYHLRKAFRKLGVKSRHELRAATQ